MNTHVAIWPNGDSSIVASDNGYELYNKLDEESDPQGCLIISVTAACRVKIEHEFPEKAALPKRMTFSVTGVPKFYTFVDDMFDYWMEGKQKTHRQALRRCTPGEVNAFFTENAENWANGSTYDEDEDEKAEVEKSKAAVELFKSFKAALSV